MSPRRTGPKWIRVERGIYRTTIERVTYTATWYPSGGPGTRAYWTIQTDEPDRNYDDGNDWYCPSFEQVRYAVERYARKLAYGPNA